MLGHFGMRQAVVKSQGHALMLRCAEVVDAAVQYTCVDGVAQQFRWTRRVVGQGIGNLGAFVVVLCRVFQSRACGDPAQAVGGAVTRNVGQSGQGLAALWPVTFIGFHVQHPSFDATGFRSTVASVAPGEPAVRPGPLAGSKTHRRHGTLHSQCPGLASWRSDLLEP